jgi:hypothetical protein
MSDFYGKMFTINSLHLSQSITLKLLGFGPKRHFQSFASKAMNSAVTKK